MIPEDPKEKIAYFEERVGSSITLEVSQYGVPRQITDVLKKVEHGHLDIGGYSIHVQSVKSDIKYLKD